MLQLFSQLPLGLYLVSLNIHRPGVRHGNVCDVWNSPGENAEHEESQTMFSTGKRTPQLGSWNREVHSHIQDLGMDTSKVAWKTSSG